MFLILTVFTLCASSLVLSLIYLGVKKEEGEFFGGAALTLLILGLTAACISDNIRQDDRIKDCVKQGMNVITIEKTNYCKL